MRARADDLQRAAERMAGALRTATVAGADAADLGQSLQSCVAAAAAAGKEATELEGHVFDAWQGEASATLREVAGSGGDDSVGGNCDAELMWS